MDKLLTMKLIRLVLELGKSDEAIAGAKGIFKLIKKKSKNAEKASVDSAWKDFCNEVGIPKTDLE